MKPLAECGLSQLLLDTNRFALAIVVMLASGCAVAKGSPAPLIAAPEQNVQPILLADASVQSPPSVTSSDAAQDEPFDPFAKPDTEGMEEYDPWESLNTKFFEFNRQLDRWILKPVAKGYNAVVPNVVQIGVSNVSYNSRVTPRLLNNLFQGKFKGAGIEAGRFLINTTVGIGGFFDVAQRFNLTTPEEDTGQTLGFYGVKPGPYLMVPLLGPYTVRDLIGYGGDIVLNPIYWFIVPTMHNIDAIPTVVDVEERAATYAISIGARATEIVNDRSLNLEKFQGVEESTLDLYAPVRHDYLQKRAKAIRD